MLARWCGLGRSLVMYHGRPWRHRRMVRFYRQFLEPGDLAFDVGAHVGSRVRAWRAIGARVVAVEPQPDLVRLLRLGFGRDRDVVVVPLALGARPGAARIAVSSATPTVSSMSSEWRSTVGSDRRFARVHWDRTVDVEVSTLDELVRRHGEPAFCKIDVEGYELDVLRGLTRPVRGLSFEYVAAAHEATLAVLEQVERLGSYVYNYSPVETMRWASDTWLGAAALVRLLEAQRPAGRSGDVYATAVRDRPASQHAGRQETGP